MLSLKYMMRLEELFYFGYNKAKSVNGGGTMKFRPCIDIHNGKVKQIVGGSLKDEMNQAILFQNRMQPGMPGYTGRKD